MRCRRPPGLSVASGRCQLTTVVAAGITRLPSGDTDLVLYLVQPHRQLQWADLPASTTMQLAQEHDLDLARLPWQPSEEPDSGIVLQLALRRGAACSLGLVVDGAYLAEHTQGTHGPAIHRAAGMHRPRSDNTTNT